MSRGTKIAIGIVGGLAVLCICVAVIFFVAAGSVGSMMTQAITEQPDQVAELAQEMVDYTLPAGYSEQFGMSFFGFNLVAFGTGRSSDNQMLVLMQFPQALGLDQAQMERQMQQSLEQQTGQRNTSLEVVEETTTIIRDQTVRLTIREGSDSNGVTMRQMTGTFQGKEGGVLLMIMGRTQDWDQAAVDAFIASLR